MKNFSKIMAILWIIAAFFSVLVFLLCGYDFDKLMIAALELLMAAEDYADYANYKKSK